jgi:DNA-dependent RNA polymerase auxiliary subunit epsilon
MQGISNNRHKRMTEALLQLEEIMKDYGHDADSNEMRKKRQLLENSYHIYIEMLEKLSVHILVYEELHDDIRVNTVSKRLARLKKVIKPVSQNFIQLRDAIASFHGA